MIAARYTVMRILIFAGFLALFSLVGLDIVWAAVAAAVASMVVSYFLLAPDRERLAAGLERRVEDRITRRREQLHQERVAEDDQ